jgi:pyruvate/2-oxoglutarate/acetoin dehydrogenase E1 component
MHTPGIKVVMPASPADAKGLLAPVSPMTIRVCSSRTSRCCSAKTEALPLGEYGIPLGTADIKRPGEHLSVITCGAAVHTALAAAEALSADGVSL